MTTGKVNRLFRLFLGSGLSYRAEWDGNRIVAITVFRDPEFDVLVDMSRPAPSERQLAAIRDVLESDGLSEEDATARVYFGHSELEVPAVRYAAKG